MTCVSFSSLLGQGSAKSCSLLTTAWPLSATAKVSEHDADTWNDIWEIISWSLNALADGKHPRRDK
eukprot:1594947-Pyramimonas_sp.AAC.1